MLAKGPVLTPPLRVVMSTRTFAGAGQSGTIQSRDGSSISQYPQQMRDVRGRRRLPCQRFAGPRMNEGERGGVQRLAGKIQRLRGQGAASIVEAIHRIADQRMSDRMQVHANLMRAAGFKAAAQQRPGPPTL